MELERLRPLRRCGRAQWEASGPPPLHSPPIPVPPTATAGAVAFVGDVDWQGSTIGHGVAVNTSDAAARALLAGLDLELTCCELPAVYPTLEESVRAGRVPEAAVDTALRHSAWGAGAGRSLPWPL